MSLNFFVILLNIFYLIAVTKLEKYLCQNEPKCSCHQYSFSRMGYIACIETHDVNFNKIDLKSSPSLRLKDVTFSNISLLMPLRHSNTSKMSLTDCKINSSFKWDWLPTVVDTLTMSHSAIDFKQLHVDGTNCSFPWVKKFSYLSVNYQSLNSIPYCVPNSLEKMKLESNNFKNFKQGFPRHLKTFKLSANKFNFHISKMFTTDSESLKMLWIHRQPFSDGKWPHGLPSKRLEILYMTYCNLSTVSLDVLKPLWDAHKLHTLSLAHNKLENVPEGLPPSLQDLNLGDNEIEYIDPLAWVTLTNLTSIELYRNKLVVVPSEMPVTLTGIHLNKNLIEYSPADSFSHMINLKEIHLSYNRLSSMPNGIPPKFLQSYSINNNRITNIRSEDEYDFCSNCITMLAGNNPFICDKNMLAFLIWYKQHFITKFTHDFTEDDQLNIKCSDSPIDGFDNIQLTTFMKYKNFIKKPPNNRCKYTIEELICVDANLSFVPVTLPPGLVEVKFQNNFQLSNIPDFYFANQSNLHTIDLDNNSLAHIPYGLPTELSTLSQRKNKISFLSKKDMVSLKSLTYLRHLYLEGNLLTTFDATCLAKLEHLKWIGLGDNPWHCDCSFWPTSQWLYHLNQGIHGDKGLDNFALAMCSSPESAKGKRLSFLSGHFRHGLQCTPSHCHIKITKDNIFDSSLDCSINAPSIGLSVEKPIPGILPKFQESNYWTDLDLSGLQLNTDGFNLTQLSNLQSIILANNSFTLIPQHLPSTIQILNLSYNQIDTISPGLNITLPNLRVLDLRNNNIKMIARKEISMLSVLDSVDLRNNPLVCNCSIRHLALWIQSKNENEKTNANQSLKQTRCLNNDLKNYLIVELLEEEYCPGISMAKLLYPTIGVALFILIAVVFVNIYLHKTRQSKKHNYILQGFKRLLEKDEMQVSMDSDLGLHEYKYDAFVSYAPQEEDHEFILELIETLEYENKYKLCLHERDFTPGLGITDNIVNAINSSSHIILLLSNNFVESMWCQYEVQMSLVELHRRRKSKLLLAIVFEGVENHPKFDGHLKKFLDVITCFDVPLGNSPKERENFWLMLQESLK